MKRRTRGMRAGPFLRFILAVPLAGSGAAMAAEEAPPPKASGQPAAQAARTPVPPAAMMADAEKEIRELFKEEYQKKTPAQMSELAKKLLSAGRETKDDLITQYVALREAKDVALAAGDMETAMTAIDALTQSFAVDGAELKAAALLAASKGQMTPEDAEKMLAAGLDTLDRLVKDAQYDAALKVVTPLEDLARRVRNADLAKNVQTRAKEVRAQQAEWAKVKPHLDKLKDNPDDLEAALAAARYYVASKDDWARALPLLAKSSNQALKAAAVQDLAQPEDPAAKADLGDLWWTASEKESSPFKDALQDRAASWYVQTLGGLTGVRKLQVEKRIQTAAGATGSAAGSGRLAALSYKDGLIRSIKTENGIRGVCFDPDGRHGLVAGDAGLHLYDLETGKKAKTIDTPGPVLCWSVSPDGRRLVAAGTWGADKGGEAKVWDVATGTEQCRFSPPVSAKTGRFIVKAVTIFPDGRPMVLGYYYEDSTPKIFQIQDGKAVGGRLQWYWATTIWSSDSSILLQASSLSSASYSSPKYRWARILDGRTGRELRELKEMAGVVGVQHYGLSRDGRLAFASGDGVESTPNLKIFEVATGRALQSIQFEPDKERGRIHRIVIFPDNRRIAAACHSGKIIIWDIPTGKAVKELPGEEYLWHLDISPDNRFLLVGGEHTLRLFGVAH